MSPIEGMPAGLLTLSTTHILSWIILCWRKEGAIRGTERCLATPPSPYHLDACSTRPLVLTIEVSPDMCPHGRNPPMAKNHFQGG